ALAKTFDGFARDGRSFLKAGIAQDAHMLARHFRAALAEEVAALAADGFDLDFTLAMIFYEFLPRLDHVGVKSAGQAFIAGEEQQQDALLRPAGQQRIGAGPL